MLLWRRSIERSFVTLIVSCTTLLASPSFGDAVGVAPSVVDLRLQPGEVVQRTITVINTDDEPRTFQFFKDNFTPSEEPGVPRFDGGAGDDLPSWISIQPDLLSISPGATAEGALTVAVPPGARPGDYYGVVFVAPSSPEATSARTAVLVFVTVLGEARYDLDLVSMHLDRRFSDSTEGSLALRVQNAGNVYLQPSGTIEIDPWIGISRQEEANPERLRILPGQSREWELSWGASPESSWRDIFRREWRGFAIGPVKVRAELEADGVSEEAQELFWVFPWRLVLLVLALAVLSRSFIRLMRRRSTK